MMPDTLMASKSEPATTSASTSDQPSASGTSPQYLEDTYDLLFQRYVNGLSEVIKGKEQQAPEGSNNNRGYCNNNQYHHHHNGFRLEADQALRKNKVLKMDTSGDPMEHGALLAQLQGVTLKDAVSNPIITFSHVEDSATGPEPEDLPEEVQSPEVEFAEVDLAEGSGRTSPMLEVPKMDLSMECKRPPL